MKKQNSDNFLEKKPIRAAHLGWSEDNGIITLEIENKGIFNKLAQKIFKKPPVSYIHLDEMGSFVWPYLDGDKTIIEIGKLVEEKFGENANPLYERLSKYMSILESYGFISWNER